MPKPARRALFGTEPLYARIHLAMDDLEFEAKLKAAKHFYDQQLSLHNPFLNEEVLLDARGFMHIRYSKGRERSKDNQALRFTLLPYAVAILKRATTVQEYRRRWLPSRRHNGNGQTPSPETIEWWGFVSIFAKEDIGVRVVVRRIGEGRLHFWSVMPYGIPPRAYIYFNEADEYR